MQLYKATERFAFKQLNRRPATKTAAVLYFHPTKGKQQLAIIVSVIKIFFSFCSHQPAKPMPVFRNIEMFPLQGPAAQSGLGLFMLRCKPGLTGLQTVALYKLGIYLTALISLFKGEPFYTQPSTAGNAAHCTNPGQRPTLKEKK